MDSALPRRPQALAACPVPLLFDPALPQAGVWVAMPLPLLRQLPALSPPAGDGGSIAYLGLAEQLATERQDSRMTLNLAYIPAIALAGLEQALQRLGLVLQAVALRVPGCAEMLRRLPRLDAQAVRFGFQGARLTLADGRQGLVTGQQGHGGCAALQVTLGPELAVIPMRHFADRVRAWTGPSAPCHHFAKSLENRLCEL